MAAISSLLLVCLVHRGEVSSAPCGEDLGMSLGASLGSQGGSSFVSFLRATTAPVRPSEPCWSPSYLGQCIDPSICSELKQWICTSKSVTATFTHSQLPEALVHSQQARRIHTWWAMEEKKRPPPGRPQATDSGHPHGVVFVPGVSIWGFAFFCGENGLDLRNWFCFLSEKASQ